MSGRRVSTRKTSAGWLTRLPLSSTKQHTPWFTLEEYGGGQGKEYGEVTGPHHQAYYGRGHVQLTWEENYIKGEQNLAARYGVDAPFASISPQRCWNNETSALVLYDGMIHWGWFTGVEGSPTISTKQQRTRSTRAGSSMRSDKADLIAGILLGFQKASHGSGRMVRRESF